MTDETDKSPPISAVPQASGSAAAPFLFFDVASAYTLADGVGRITLEAIGLRSTGEPERVTVAHLRMGVTALLSLRAAIDGIVLLATPKPEGPAN